jgi:hypothetical protein
LENLVFLSHVPCRSTNPKEKNHFPAWLIR